MSFLGVAFLFALPLAAAPLLLHLFDRQRSVVIEWGAMQFLVEATRHRTSARRIQQWLLLLLRTLAVFCLVMALARPLIRSHWLGLSERLETIVIIDNSLSMRRNANEKSLFDAALRSAIDVVNGLPAGDSLRVLTTSPYPVWLMPAAISLNVRTRADMEEKLRAQQPTQGRSDLLASLFSAVLAEPVPGIKRRHIVLLTDGQATDWSTADAVGWQRLQVAFRSVQVPTTLEIIETGTKSGTITNVAINHILSNRNVLGPQQTVTVTAQIQNHGIIYSDACSLSWMVSGQEQHRSQVPSLAPGEVHEVVWKHSFPSVGVHRIVGEIQSEDALNSDNRGTVIVEVVDRIPVLVVESDPNAEEMTQDAYFLQAAMGWIDGEPLESQGVHVPTLVPPTGLDRSDLNQFRAVIIPNLTELTENSVRKLKDFVVEGGGLWVALGPRTDVERFNQFFFADADGLAPLAINHVVDESADPTKPRTTIDSINADHPATASLADETRLDTSKVIVTRRFQFAPPRAGENVSALLSLTNGEPLAVEKLVGRGRVIIQAVPLRLQWSDLARSQAFVVMVQDWLNYLTQPQGTRHNLTPGDPISLRLPGTNAREATLHTPRGDDVELTADTTADGVVFRTSRTVEPGDYSLEVALSGDPIPFQVARDPRESNLAPLTAADRELLAGLSAMRPNAVESSHGSIPSDPLWPLLLVLVGVFMVADLVVSSRMSCQRFGGAPIAETTEASADGSAHFPLVATAKPSSTTEVTRTDVRTRQQI